MRIGERLIREEMITIDQLNEALSKQVLRGGRIGTNLIELGHIDIDSLGECLGRHHGMPVAMEKHFDMAPHDLQQKVSEELAARWGVVPLGRVLGNSAQIAVAAMYPLPESARNELREALDSEVILAIAPELRMLYQLERVFGIPRSNRYIRLPPEEVQPPIADPTEDEAMVDIQLHLVGEESEEDEAGDEVELDIDEVEELDIEALVSEDDELADDEIEIGDENLASDLASALRSAAESAAAVPDPVSEAPTSRGEAQTTAPGAARSADSPADGSEAATTASPPATPPATPPASPPPTPVRPASAAAPSGEPSGRERRHFVKTLADDPSPAETQQAQLARIRIKRVSSSSQPGITVPPPAPSAVPSSLESALRSIRQATGRDRVGDLVISALRDLFDQAFDAAAILVVRNPIAIGWKGFIRDGSDEVIETIAIPLAQPSVILEPFKQHKTYVGPPPNGGTELDRRLWVALSSGPPKSVAVAPIVLHKQTVCMLYAHSHRDPDEIQRVLGDDLAGLADSTSRAFGRLIRAAQR